MTEAKLKIIEWNKNLFPELAASLKANGQIEDVLRDEDGVTVDGVKREILLGRENVRFKVVPKGSASSNIHHLNKVQRKAVVNYKYQQLYEKYGSMEAKEAISKLYGVSLRTIERDLNQDVATNVVTSKSNRKDRMYKDTATWNPFIGCHFDCAYCKPSFQQNHYFLMQHRDCGGYEPHFHAERLDPRKIPDEKIIFVCGDSDISFCHHEDIGNIIEVMKLDRKEGYGSSNQRTPDVLSLFYNACQITLYY